MTSFRPSHLLLTTAKEVIPQKRAHHLHHVVDVYGLHHLIDQYIGLMDSDVHHVVDVYGLHHHHADTDHLI
jgi:hypothetical protein